MGGTVFFLEAFHLSLRQGHGFGIFSGAAEFVDFGAERRGLAFLRQRWRVEPGARQQRETHGEYHSIAGFHAGFRWALCAGLHLSRGNVRSRSNPHQPFPHQRFKISAPVSTLGPRLRRQPHQHFA